MQSNCELECRLYVLLVHTTGDTLLCIMSALRTLSDTVYIQRARMQHDTSC
jgi:hypothetical protein